MNMAKYRRALLIGEGETERKQTENDNQRASETDNAKSSDTSRPVDISVGSGNGGENIRPAETENSPDSTKSDANLGEQNEEEPAHPNQ